MERKHISVETYKQLHAEHEAGTCLHDLSVKYNYRLATIFYGFVRLGLTIHRATNEQRKVNRVKEDWFSVIDEQTKAYYLGLLMADGYVNYRKDQNKSARVCLKLHKTDRYLIEQFAELVQPGANLYKDGNAYSCQINSNQLVRDLRALGLHERKSTVGETLPMLDDKWMSHFVRGFFDGDGSISLTARNKSTIYICCSNRSFLEELQRLLTDKEIKSTIHVETRGHLNYRDMYTLHINDRRQFYHYMYKDAYVFMIRKKLKYDHVNTVLTAKNERQRRA